MLEGVKISYQERVSPLVLFASQCYLRLHDKPLTGGDEDADAGSSNLSAKELKKLRSKQRRAEKKAQLHESNKGKVCFAVFIEY